jgi:hypothetical protein
MRGAGDERMKSWKSALIALVAAAIVEGVSMAVLMGFGRIGGEGPNPVGLIGIILHAPGIMIADHFHLTGNTDTVVITGISFLQYFVVFWAVIAIIQKWRGKRSGDRQ